MNAILNMKPLTGPGRRPQLGCRGWRPPVRPPESSRAEIRRAIRGELPRLGPGRGRLGVYPGDRSVPAEASPALPQLAGGSGRATRSGLPQGRRGGCVASPSTRNRGNFPGPMKFGHTEARAVAVVSSVLREGKAPAEPRFSGISGGRGSCRAGILWRIPPANRGSAGASPSRRTTTHCHRGSRCDRSFSGSSGGRGSRRARILWRIPPANRGSAGASPSRRTTIH